ncbi:MAG TPA: hypothetical protein VJP79_02935 [Nitrososphaera sp.]|nr:hypothetical protein [Nitrososphaera sp.]
MDKKGYIVAAGVAVGAIVGVMVLFMSQASFGKQGGEQLNATTTASSSSSDRPDLMLILLKGQEDSSVPVARYNPDLNQAITLHSSDHIRFEPPNNRPPESLRIIAEDVDDGRILILRKSYDVNNEFFVNLDHGEYQLRAQASWFDKGSYVYTYDINVA